jgi:hypothetical protein
LILAQFVNIFIRWKGGDCLLNGSEIEVLQELGLVLELDLVLVFSSSIPPKGSSLKPHKNP